MFRPSWSPKLRSMLLASILLGAIAGSLNSYVASVNAQGVKVCVDEVGGDGQICYTFGCFCSNGICKCQYYGAGGGCPTNRFCSQTP